MTRGSMFFRRLLAGLMLGGCLSASPAAAEKPLNRFAVSPECLRLLDGLSRGDVGPQDLTALLVSTFAEEYGDKYRIGDILREALIQGALKSADVEAAMRAAGCSLAEAGQPTPCGRVATLVVAGVRALVAEPPASAAGQAPASTPSGGPVRDTYSAGELRLTDAAWQARQTLVERGSSLTITLELFARERPWELFDEEGQAALSGLWVGKAPSDTAKRDAIRIQLGSILAERLLLSKGRKDVVDETRQVPAETLRGAWETDSRYVMGAPIGSYGAVRCVVEAWRAPAATPDQWAAWKSLLECQRGW